VVKYRLTNDRRAEMDKHTDGVLVPTKEVLPGHAKFTAEEDNGVEVFVLHDSDTRVKYLFPMDALISGLTELRDGHRDHERAEDALRQAVGTVVRSTIRDVIAPTTKDKQDPDAVAEQVDEAVCRVLDLIADGALR
jgi:hypothetical protein